MPFYERGPVRIHYEEAGSGFPLLVIPGGGLNSTVAGLATHPRGECFEVTDCPRQGFSRRKSVNLRAGKRPIVRAATRQGRGCARSRAAPSSNSVAPLRGRRGKGGADQEGQAPIGVIGATLGYVPPSAPLSACPYPQQEVKGRRGVVATRRFSRAETMLVVTSDDAHAKTGAL